MMLCSFLDLRQLVGPETMINVNLVGLMEVLLLFFSRHYRCYSFWYYVDLVCTNILRSGLLLSLII